MHIMNIYSNLYNVQLFNHPNKTSESLSESTQLSHRSSKFQELGLSSSESDGESEELITIDELLGPGIDCKPSACFATFFRFLYCLRAL